MLILTKPKVQAIEKITVNTNWIPLVWVFLVAIIAILKVIDSERLKGYIFSIFNKGFLEDELEENTTFLNLFQFLIFAFSTGVLALSFTFILNELKSNFLLLFSNFLHLFSFIIVYYLIKSTIESALSSLFFIKKEVRFYIISKYSYQYSISFLLLILFLIVNYSPLKPSIFIYSTVFLFLIKFVFQLGNNKKLIFSELFYFILYICALEIAPLLILFKWML